ncbi:MAG: hypothetical protein Q4C42_03240 [Clostridia bacterium]|nr:hypothetical protein [Clostridia bacterium]
MKKHNIKCCARIALALLGVAFVIISMYTESEHSYFLIAGLGCIDIALIINAVENRKKNKT